MIARLKELFGMGPATDFAQILREGGVIVDVRSKAEYAGGHIKGSRNIPLNSLNSGSGILKDKDQPIITCCASGMRSASAKNLLRAQGFKKVYNGGGWIGLNNKINK